MTNVFIDNLCNNTRLSDIEHTLSEMGITIRNTDMSFRDFSDVIDDLSHVWKQTIG